jgi:hypothetical protein
MKQFRDTPYFVTETGDVYRNNKKLKPYKNTKGYLKISCHQDGKQKIVAVHRMVGELYIPNPKNLPQINHLDGDKSNNRVENLEWCSQSHNIQHRLNILKVGIDQRHKNTKIPAKEVALLRWKKSINYPMNVREIAKKWGVRVDYLRKVINGNQRKLI